MDSLCLRLFTTVYRCWQSISSCGIISTQLLGVVCHSYYSKSLEYHTSMYLVHIERDLGVQIINYLWTVLPLTTISHGLLTLRVIGELRGVGYHFEVLLLTIDY